MTVIRFYLRSSLEQDRLKNHSKILYSIELLRSIWWISLAKFRILRESTIVIVVEYNGRTASNDRQESRTIVFFSVKTSIEHYLKECKAFQVSRPYEIDSTSLNFEWHRKPSELSWRNRWYTCSKERENSRKGPVERTDIKKRSKREGKFEAGTKINVTDVKWNGPAAVG